MANISTKYHYLYKITNNLNGHFYYGVHNTNDLNDGYMGSGSRLHYAFKKYGIENFTKEILKYFNTSKEAFEYEAEVVNEDLVDNINCYNVIKGGTGWNTIGTKTVYDKKLDKYYRVSTNDKRLKNGELIGSNVGKTLVKDKDNNYKFISLEDERLKNGEFKPFSTGLILVKDKNNKNYLVDINDERLKTGELTIFWKSRKHSEESKNKLKETHKKFHYQLGEKNSQYGTCWITKDKENKKIKKEELEYYISLGWFKGRKLK